jgi:alcohol dehydrogenase
VARANGARFPPRAEPPASARIARFFCRCQSGGGWILGHLIDGTQAELARIPFADNSLYKVPEGLSDEQVLFLSDILPTGFEVGVLNGNVRPAEVIMGLTDGLGADVAIEAVGIPQTFELCTDLVRPGGRVANVGVHGHPATLHLEKLWIRNITITTGLVDTRSTPTLLRLVSEGRLDPQPFATHRFTHDQILDAYGVFADAARTNALKVVLTRS